MATKKTDKPTLPPGFKLPAGFVIQKAGGRPKKEARDAAVFLAHFWRTDEFNEIPAKVERWIIESWEKAGPEASKGISDPAHVRSAIRRAKDRGLKQCLLQKYERGMCTAIEGGKDAQGNYVIAFGARIWVWVEGMTEATQGRLDNLKVEHHQDVI